MILWLEKIFWRKFNMPIGRIEEIVSERINPQEYFASLIEQLSLLEFITLDKKQQILYETIEILKNMMERHSGGSSSLSKENSQMLLDGIQFVIALALKQCTLSNAISLLIQYSINDIYQMGLTVGKEYVLAVTKDIATLQADCIDTKLEVYNDTVYGGLSGFLKVYNFTFTPHQKEITVDYIALLPINYLDGIEYIRQYVRYLQYENIFCKQFSRNKVDALLQRYHKDYWYLIFNISEVILIEAIGLAILQKDIQTLLVSKKDRNLLLQQLQGYSKEELSKVLMSAYYDVMQQLPKVNQEIHNYFYQCMNHIYDVVYHALEIREVKQIFL